MLVGVLMMRGLARIDMTDLVNAVPIVLTLLVTVLTNNLINGMALGTLSYIALEVAMGRRSRIPAMVWGLGVVFIAYAVVIAQIFEMPGRRESLGHQIQEPTRSAHQHLTPGRRHRRYTVVNDDKSKLDEPFDNIGLQEATVRQRVAKRAQRLPLVRREIEVDVVAHVASNDSNVHAPLLAALHEDHATTMSPEFVELFRTSLHELPRCVTRV